MNKLPNNAVMRLKKIYELEIDGAGPFNFELTVHKPAGPDGWEWLTPFEIYSEGVIWAGIRLSTGESIGLKISDIGSVQNPKVLCRIFSRKNVNQEEKDEVVRTVSRCLSLKKDISDFYQLCDRYPPLKQAKKDLWGMRKDPFPNLFSALIVAITLQNAPWKRSIQMVRSIYANYGEKINFDNHEIIICPPPNLIAKISEQELRTTCKLGYRDRILKECASAIVKGELPTTEELEKMSHDDAKKILMKIKGIGEYSADITGVYPSFPVDSWNARIFRTVFNINIEGRPEQTISIIKRYAAKEFGIWQGYVYTYILNDLQNLSKRFGAIP